MASRIDHPGHLRGVRRRRSRTALPYIAMQYVDGETLSRPDRDRARSGAPRGCRRIGPTIERLRESGARAPRRARGGSDPPRHQARQHHDHDRRRAGDPRLRPRARRSTETRSTLTRDGRLVRHARLHVARADLRRSASGSTAAPTSTRSAPRSSSASRCGGRSRRPTREALYQAILHASVRPIRRSSTRRSRATSRVVLETALEKDRDAPVPDRARLRRGPAPRPRLRADPRAAGRPARPTRALGAAQPGARVGARGIFPAARRRARAHARPAPDTSRERDSKNAALGMVERLSDVKRLEDLQREADALWPAVPATVPAMKAWLERASRLEHALPGHREALALLRDRALVAQNGEAPRFSFPSTEQQVASRHAGQARPRPRGLPSRRARSGRDRPQAPRVRGIGRTPHSGRATRRLEAAIAAIAAAPAYRASGSRRRSGSFRSAAIPIRDSPSSRTCRPAPSPSGTRGQTRVRRDDGPRPRAGPGRHVPDGCSGARRGRSRPGRPRG